MNAISANGSLFFKPLFIRRSQGTQEHDCHILKAMVFSLDKENADLQHQLLEREAASIALKSTVANLQRELQETNHQRSEEVSALVSQLHVSARHIFKLEC
jgi:cell division septum initiation protein DivIVA